MILGGGGSFAIHTALHLAKKEDTKKIVTNCLTEIQLL